MRERRRAGVRVRVRVSERERERERGCYQGGALCDCRTLRVAERGEMSCAEAT